MFATVEQFGPEMAKNGIQTGFKMLGGEKLTGWIKTPVKLVTAADVGGAAPAPAAAERPQVCLVMKSLANEFFKVMAEATEKWAKSDNTFDLTMVGMNSETDIDTQINAVENCITKGVDLIVLAPADSVGLVPSVKKALAAGITVVNFDVMLDQKALGEAGLKDFLFVGPDNAEGAKMAGDALAAKLGPGGKVIIIEGNPGADNATQRKNGFLQSVKDGKLELLDSVTAHWETEEANTVMTNLLTKHPDVQGVMAANDSMALGIIKALDAAGKSGQVQVVAFDNIPAVQPLLKDGKLLASIDQFGPEMAKNAIQTGFKMLGGEELTGWIKTPLKLITINEAQ
jgi:ribose transport system substrate-binding protein